MKRFLSLVLSALFVFQLGIACDAASQWDKRNVICVDVSGKSVQPQGLIVPYIPQQPPIINVTTPQPIPQQHNIAIQQPEMKPNFNVKVDATTTADKLWSWLKIALTVALGYAALKTFWPVVAFFTGLSNPIDTVKGWGEGAVKWVKGIWNEGGEGTSDSDHSENVKSSEGGAETSGSSSDQNVNHGESGWIFSFLQKLILPLITLGMMRGRSVGKTL